jgi:hypothetical protein
MNTLDSIKAQLPKFAVLSEEQSVFTKGGEDKRDPRPGANMGKIARMVALRGAYHSSSKKYIIG